MKKSSTKNQTDDLTEFPTTINVTLPFELNNWSDSLTFDQISDTLFIIGKYINSEDHSMFTYGDLCKIQDWLATNNIEKFLAAKEAAVISQIKQMELEEYARDIMSYPVRRASSH